MMLALLIGAAVAYGLLCLGVFWTQRSLIYFPQAVARATGPTMTLPTGDGATVVVSTHAQAWSNAVLYFGGNAEDVSQTLPSLVKAFPDRAIYLMRYRGYGGSTGEPSEPALVADASALFDSAQKDHANIAVVGRSLGSGVAVQLAARRPVARLVLVTPFDSLQSLAAQHYPYLPVRLLLKDTYRSSRFAPELRVPTLLIAAENDEIVPRSSTDSLLRSFAPGIASLTLIPGTGHNTISESPAYIPALRTGIGAP